MLQKITISILFFVGLFFETQAQATWLYAGGNGSVGAEVSKSICTDASGNIYVIGNFSNTVDLDYGAGTANVTSAGSNDIFIASYTSAGAYRWSLRSGSTGNDNGVSICVNGTDVYAYGLYASSAAFGSTTLTSSGVSDAFLVKLNASTGAVTWAVSHGGTAGDSPGGMCLDASGNIYTIEGYNTSWTACSAYTSIGSSDLLIQKVNPTNGACIWAATGGSTSGDGGSGSGLCYVPATNKIVVSTAFSGPSATFGAFTLTNANGATAQNDIAIIELDASNGNFISAIAFGTATADDASSCVYDPSTGDVFISGGFPSNITLPNGGLGITLTTAGANDIWLGRYSPVNHNFVWAKSAGGTSGDINQERSYGITSDGAGTIAISGSHLSNPTNFGSLSLANSSGFGQIFVAGYSASTGTELWVNNAITNSPALQSVGRGITTNSSTGVYWVTGTFCTTTTFGAQPSITSAGFADLFNAKFSAPITCSNPVIGTQPTNKSVCFNGNTSFSIVATGASTYQWQENTGSGFTNITNGGVYSGATTATLSLAGINFSSGYLYRCIAINGACQTISNSVTLTVSAYFNTASQTNVSCDGGSNGSATLNAAGGIAPYNYSWSPSGGTGATASGLSAGVYTVIVTDANSCSTTKTYTITQPSALITSTAITNVLCNGSNNGSATVTASGGTSPYTYLWSSAQTTSVISGQIAGVRTVTVTDANGCTSSKSTTISQPVSVLSASNVVTNISCFGGSNGTINLTPAGGTAAYTFNWGGGVTTEDRTGLLAGAYTCTITDANGCTTTSNATVTQPTSALATSTAVTNVSCNGGSNGSATVTASGGTSPYTYLWSSAQTTSVISGQIAGVRTVTVTDANGCTSSKSTNITQPTSALSASNVVTNISCFGGSNGTINLTPAGGTSAYTFNWGGGVTTEDRTGLLAGAYTCTITDANGCTTTSNATVTQPTSALSASNVVTNVSCFGGSNGTINLTPTGGTAAYTFNWGGGITTEDRTGLLAGAYTCTITDANGCTTTSNATVTQPASALAATITSTNTACLSNTGVASVSASGGTPSYTYSWSPSGGIASTASSLGVGTYSCVIKDANLCSITKTINITTSGAPTATIIAQTNVTCNSLCNGSATVSASGGTTPYNYTWSNANTTTTATNLCAGVITCTVTGSNGCSTVVNTTITQPTVLSANATTSAILCNGGVSSVTVSATGGTFSYIGVGTFTTLAGTKSYTVTDANGCSTTTSISVSEPSILSANSSASSILCNGGTSTITVSATGGTASYIGVGTFTTLASTKSYTVTDANGCSTTTSISVSEPTILSANATASSILCNGGISTITVSAAGGIASYTGTGTFTVNTGTQTYTVTDANGCSTTTSISISEPNILSANATASSILCNGEASTITVTAIGGTTSYTGVGTFTANAGTQTYTVTDANGCSATTSISISEPSAISSSQSVTLCAGQSIIVGTSTYNASGTYTNVLSAINGCDSTVTTNLIVKPAIVSSQTVTLCAGQSLTIGSNTYTTTGIYTNTFTAVNGCDSTLTTDLIINPAIVSSQTVTLCAGQSLTVGTNTYTTTGIYTNTFTAVSGCDSTVTTNLTINNMIDVTTTLSGLTISANESSATYQWIDCDNSNQPISGETNQSFTASANGNYAVIVTQNSCSGTSACVNISTVGIRELNNLTGIKLYPNPNNGSFTISGIEINTTISIYNSIGELIKSIQSIDNNTTVDLSDNSTGIYFIKIKNNKGEVIQKLIKQ